MSITRRQLLIGTAAAGAAAVAGKVVLAGDPDHSTVPTSASSLDPAKGILVLLTLYGGNDGLNTVVPAHDAAYRGPRGPLALDESKVLPLGEGLSLHPSLPV